MARPPLWLLAGSACLVGLACGKLVGSNRPPAKRVGSDGEVGGLAKLSRGEVSYAPQPQPIGDDAGPLDDPSPGLRYGDYTFEHDADYRPAPYPYDGYRVQTPLPPTGVVAGRVSWPSAPTIDAAVTPASAGASSCPATVTNRTLSLGDGRALQGAVVYLDDIEQGRALLGRMQSGYADRHFQIGGLVEWRACRIDPYVQLVAPVGAVLTATSTDPIGLELVRVHGEAREVADRFDLPGSGAIVERMLHRAGFYRLESGPSDALASVGWIAVARHPYYAVTDIDGRFSLEQVPAGRYTLVVWHPPVMAADGAPSTVPVVIKRSVTVAAHRTTTVLLRLPRTAR